MHVASARAQPGYIREGNHQTWKLCSITGDTLVRFPNKRAARPGLVRAVEAWRARGQGAEADLHRNNGIFRLGR